MAVRKHFFDFAVVSISNNGWNTTAISLFLNNIFISFLDAIKHFMNFAPINNSGPPLNGLTPLLEITDGKPHIKYFFAVLIVAGYLAWLKAVNSFELDLLVLVRLRALSAYVIVVLRLLLQDRDVQLLILCLILTYNLFLIFFARLLFWDYLLLEVFIGFTFRLIQTFTSATAGRNGIWFGILIGVKAAIPFNFLSTHILIYTWKEDSIILLQSFWVN